MRAFIREYKIRYPIGFITPETLAYYADSHDHGVPQFILFGTDGKMVRRWVGWDEKNGKELTAAVQEQMQKAPAVKPAAKPTAKSAAKSSIKSSASTRRPSRPSTPRAWTGFLPTQRTSMRYSPS